MIKLVFLTSNSFDEGNDEVNDCLALKRAQAVNLSSSSSNKSKSSFGPVIRKQEATFAEDKIEL